MHTACKTNSLCSLVKGTFASTSIVQKRAYYLKHVVKRAANFTIISVSPYYILVLNPSRLVIKSIITLTIVTNHQSQMTLIYDRWSIKIAARLTFCHAEFAATVRRALSLLFLRLIIINSTILARYASNDPTVFDWS